MAHGRRPGGSDTAGRRLRHPTGHQRRRARADRRRDRGHGRRSQPARCPGPRRGRHRRPAHRHQRRCRDRLRFARAPACRSRWCPATTKAGWPTWRPGPGWARSRARSSSSTPVAAARSSASATTRSSTNASASTSAPCATPSASSSMAPSRTASCTKRWRRCRPTCHASRDDRCPTRWWPWAAW